MAQQASKAQSITKFETVLGDLFKRNLQQATTKVLEQVHVPLFSEHVKKVLFPNGKLQIKPQDENETVPGKISADLHNKMVA